MRGEFPQFVVDEQCADGGEAVAGRRASSEVRYPMTFNGSYQLRRTDDMGNPSRSCQLTRHWMGLDLSQPGAIPVVGEFILVISRGDGGLPTASVLSVVPVDRPVLRVRRHSRVGGW